MHDTSTKLAKIDELIRNHGVKGLKVLFLFKLLKIELRKILQEQQRVSLNQFNEKTLERVCLDKARQLVKLGRENPTLEDIQELLLSLQ